jgi:hypothetical protein
VDPRTFLPPRVLPVAPTPKPGDRRPELPVTLDPRRPAVIAFLRHVGCPFAEATMRSLRAQAVSRREIQWIAISHAPEDATHRWSDAIGGSEGVLVVSDPSRRTYAAWGLGRSDVAHFLGRRSLSAVAAQARHGIRNRHPSGTRWQSAGTFSLAADGVVLWRHLPEHAGDLPDLDAAVKALT